MKKPRILVFGGSLRLESYNHQLATLAAEDARAAGADVTLIRLREYRLPLFDEDLEAAEGMPENGRKLKALFAENDGFIIASPEYNSGITAALKNSIDWVSRVTSEGEPPLSVFKGKTAAIIAASPGGYGGARSLAQLRPFLQNIAVTVLDDQVTVAKAYEAFDEEGNLKDAALRESLSSLVKSLVEKLS